MKIQGQLKRLQVAFIHEKVPQFYVYYFMNRLITASQQKIQDKILKQLQQIKSKRSYFHVITNSIKARQGCLKQLQRCLDNLFNNQDDNLTKHVFREEILHYRKLTGFVIGHIRSWKAYLNDMSPQIDFTTYLYHGEDYLLKLLNDCEFIFNSFMTRHLKFSYKNDPYIMRPYLQQKQKQKEQKFIDLFKFQDEQKNIYMIDMNFLASQRAKYLETKMNSKNQKIKQIQRIYHYKDIPLTSRIFVRKVPHTPQKKGEVQQNKQILFDNFMENKGFLTQRQKQRKGTQSQKKFKLAEISKKSDKIRKIKQVFGKTSQATTRLINSDMFETIGGSTNNKFTSPYQEKLRYTQFNPKKIKIQNMNYQTDFQNLLRKKQLQVLQGDNSHNFGPSTTHRSFKNIKIKDNLSDSRKFITKQQGFNQLEKILNQLDTFSPQKLDNFRLKKKQDPKSQTLIKLNQGKASKARLFEPAKTLLQHNQQVYVNVRNQVIEQIEKDLKEKAYYQQKRKQENEKIQGILQKKINQESLRIINDSRVKQLQGRQHLAKQFESEAVFGYTDQKPKNSQKLTYLEEELKKQMQLKWLRQVQAQLKHKTQLSQMQKQRTKQQAELNKKLQKAKQKQEMQKRFEQIERQQRAKAMKKQIELDENRKKQIQQQMRVVIERERDSMEKFAVAQRNQVQGELREAMKMQMLENLKKENQKFYDNQKKEQQIKLKERQYRQQVRAKVQQQYNLAQQMKQNRQRQQKVAKIRLVKQKLGEYDNFATKKPTKNERQIEKIANQNLLQQQKSNLFNEQQMKSRITQFPDLRESIFPKYQRNSEADKKKLRQQFQLELFAFRKPEAYQESKPEDIKTVYQEGKFPIKDFRNIIDQEMKEKEKQKEQLQKQKEKQKQLRQEIFNGPNKNENTEQIKLINTNQTQQQPQQQQKQLQKSQTNSQRFTKFSQKNTQKQLQLAQQKQKQLQKQRNQQDQLTRMKLGMTYEQYQVYKKKKQAITAKRDLQGQYSRKKAMEDKKAVVKVIQQFQRMEQLSSNLQKEKYNADNNKDVNNQFEQFPDNLSNSLMGTSQNINQSKIKTNLLKSKMKQIKQQDLQDLDNENIKQDLHRKANNNKKITIEQQQQQQQEKQAQLNKKSQALKQKKQQKRQKQKDQQVMTVTSRVTSIVQKHFITSDQQQQQPQKKPKKLKRKQNNSPTKKKKPQQIQQQNQNQPQSPTKPTLQPPKKLTTTVKLRQLPIPSLSQFFTDHFEHLPKLIKKINVYKKEQLIKFLLQHSSFSVLQYVKDSMSIGLAVILFNQNKSKYRSLNVVHLGCYDQADYLELLVSVVRYCFKNDPCQEIAMSNVYDKDIAQQWEFTKNFEKKFDPYGAIFQKKIFNTQFQRKYVLRRTIGQICKVQPISQFNRGSFQLATDSFLVQSKKQDQANQLIQSDQFQQLGYRVGYYALIAYFITEKYTQQTLAYILAKSTGKDSTTLQKTVASLAKLALSMKKNQSYRRFAQISQQKFDNIMNLNLQLLAKKQPVISFPPQSIQKPLQCNWYNYKIDLQLTYTFYSQTIPIKLYQNNNKLQQPDDYLCKYLRFTPNKKNKSFTITSTAYSSKITIIPTKDMKYKIFILDPEEYDGILEKSMKNDVGERGPEEQTGEEQKRLDLGVYLRVFFGNLDKHQIADYDHIWLPQTRIKPTKYQIPNLQFFDKAQQKTSQISPSESQPAFESHKRGIIKSNLNFTYTDYLGNSLRILPSHRDLLITPPFIIGVMNMQVQTALEGSPVFVQRVEKSDMWWIKQVAKVVKESD